MTPYGNKHGMSGVVAYEPGKRSITIRFRDGGTYLYTHESSGKAAIEAMKRHAAQGEGLATYINTHVRDKFAKKMD